MAYFGFVVHPNFTPACAGCRQRPATDGNYCGSCVCSDSYCTERGSYSGYCYNHRRCDNGCGRRRRSGAESYCSSCVCTSPGCNDLGNGGQCNVHSNSYSQPQPQRVTNPYALPTYLPVQRVVHHPSGTPLPGAVDLGVQYINGVPCRVQWTPY